MAAGGEEHADPLPQEGRLTEAQLAAAREWIRVHWSTRACPFHGETTWELDTSAAIVPAGPVFGGPAFQAFVLTCRTCRYMVFINGLTSGVFGRKEPAAEPVSAPPVAKEP